jgi:hypothetical protein
MADLLVDAERVASSDIHKSAPYWCIETVERVCGGPAPERHFMVFKGTEERHERELSRRGISRRHPFRESTVFLRDRGEELVLIHSERERRSSSHIGGENHASASRLDAVAKMPDLRICMPCRRQLRVYTRE